MSGDSIAAAARGLIGVPWRHQGRNAATGVDCVGLCLLALKEAGFQARHIPDYPRRHDGSLLLSDLQRRLGRVAVAEFKSGDVGLFQESGVPVHVGILCREEDGVVIHAHARRRKVVAEPLSSYGQPFAVFRFEGD